MEVAQVALSPLVVLLDEFLRLFAIHVAVLHQAFNPRFERGDDLDVAGLGEIGEDDLAGSADDDGLAVLAELLHEGRDE